MVQEKISTLLEKLRGVAPEKTAQAKQSLGLNCSPKIKRKPQSTEIGQTDLALVLLRQIVKLEDLVKRIECTYERMVDASAQIAMKRMSLEDPKWLDTQRIRAPLNQHRVLDVKRHEII